MALIYPVHEDAVEDDGTFGVLASDLSDQWTVEVTPLLEGEDLESVTLGPWKARDAWDFAHELLETRPAWSCVLAPLYDGPINVRELVDLIESD